jgi:phosphoribosylformylglycinamidine synthase subunit PurL
MLIECCLELLDRELLVALQDLGAAGITSSASEMAERGGVGIEIEAEKVPRREDGMEAWEVMISESQERMLAVVEPAKADEVIRLAERYELLATMIGRVTDDGELRVLDEGIERGAVSAAALVDAPE